MFRTALTLLLGVASSCQLCTLKSCRSGVEVALAGSELATLNEGPSVIRLCIDAACTEETVNFPGSVGAEAFLLDGSLLRVWPTETKEFDKAAVTLTISREGTEHFTRTWQDVKFATQFPNGPDCGGVCRVATVDAS